MLGEMKPFGTSECIEWGRIQFTDWGHGSCVYLLPCTCASWSRRTPRSSRDWSGWLEHGSWRVPGV